MEPTEPTIPASINVSLPVFARFEDAEAVAELLGLNAFEQVTVTRPSPGWAVGATGGAAFVPDLLTVVDFLIATGSVTVLAAARRFGERLGDDAYDGLRSAVVNLFRKEKERRLVEYPHDRDYAEAGGYGISFSITGDFARNDTEVTLKIAAATPDELQVAARAIVRLRPPTNAPSQYVWRGNRWRRSRDRWYEQERLKVKKKARKR